MSAQEQSSSPPVVASGKSSLAVGRDAIGNIFITGDHSQVFSGDYLDLRDSYIQPWQIFERVQLERYIGRRWLEAAVDRFLSENDRGYLVIEAQAGLGKTTF